MCFTESPKMLIYSKSDSSTGINQHGDFLYTAFLGDASVFHTVGVKIAGRL